VTEQGLTTHAQPVFFNVTLGDAEHDAVQVFSQTYQPGQLPPLYLTSDGGRRGRVPGLV